MRTHRVDGKEILAPTRSKHLQEGRKMEVKALQNPSITDYYNDKREEKQTRAKQLTDNWELMKVFVQQCPASLCFIDRVKLELFWMHND